MGSKGKDAVKAAEASAAAQMADYKAQQKTAKAAVEKQKQVYKDIDFKFSKNSFTGDLNVVQDSNAIKQSIKNIILTMKGERSFKYEFGSAIQRMLFEPSSVDTIPIITDVQSSLSSNESRITVNEINISSDNEEMKLNISYEHTLSTGDTVTEKTTVSSTTSTDY